MYKERTMKWFRRHTADIITTIGVIASFLFLSTIFCEPENMLMITSYALVAGLTDFIDGPVARKFKATSVFGSYLDRIRDRIFVYPGLLFLGWQNRGEIIFPEFLVCLILSLAFFETLIFRIGFIGIKWYLKGKEIDLQPNNWGKKKIFAGFAVVLIWIISLDLCHLGVPALKYSIWIIYLGLIFMVYWSYVSLKDYMEQERNLRARDYQGKIPYREPMPSS